MIVADFAGVDFGAAPKFSVRATGKSGGTALAVTKKTTGATAASRITATRAPAVTIVKRVPPGPSDFIPRKPGGGVMRATVPGAAAPRMPAGPAKTLGAKAQPAAIVATVLPPAVEQQAAQPAAPAYQPAGSQALYSPPAQQAPGQPWIDIGPPEIAPHMTEASFFQKNKMAVVAGAIGVGALAVGYLIFGRKAKGR